MITKLSNALIPKSTPGVRCGFCSKIIWKDDEPKGRLSILKGKPICVVCRIKIGKNWREIDKHIKKNKAKDLERIENNLQEEANKKVEDLVISIKDSETALKK
ncbi:MAG: hypothetical protein P1P85_04260 [Patescibacteria group bacterium]|nr:hypothetical protein [Patescibacteria group bacterium]